MGIPERSASPSTDRTSEAVHDFTSVGRVKARANHVVVISLDALRPEFYRDELWPAPTLQQLAHEGAAAEAVSSVFPALTYPAHTTVVTGALPARHGIWHNRPFTAAGSNRDWYWHASAIQVPTLWDLVRAAGAATAAVGWPVTMGAAIDWNLPDIWVPGKDIDSMSAVRSATYPQQLFEELEREATGILRPGEFRLGSLGRDDHVGDIGAYLFERYRPALLLVHLIGTDHIQHAQGPAGSGVRRALATADRAVGVLLEAIERSGLRERTAIIVTGDHGSSAVHTVLNPNVWLVATGLRDRRNGDDWRATFHADGGSAFLRVRDSSDREAVMLARAGLDQLDPGIRSSFRLVDRDELDALGADPIAPFALAGAPGVVFSEKAFGAFWEAGEGAGHGYHPAELEMQTGFIGCGAGLRASGKVPSLALQDIAPLVASLLGLEFTTPDGILHPRLLTP